VVHGAVPLDDVEGRAPRAEREEAVRALHHEVAQVFLERAPLPGPPGVAVGVGRACSPPARWSVCRRPSMPTRSHGCSRSWRDPVRAEPSVELTALRRDAAHRRAQGAASRPSPEGQSPGPRRRPWLPAVALADIVPRGRPHRAHEQPARMGIEAVGPQERNWLFTWVDLGGERNAAILTIIGTCICARRQPARLPARGHPPHRAGLAHAVRPHARHSPGALHRRRDAVPKLTAERGRRHVMRYSTAGRALGV
jgi:hypothetical protein